MCQALQIGASLVSLYLVIILKLRRPKYLGNTTSIIFKSLTSRGLLPGDWVGGGPGGGGGVLRLVNDGDDRMEAKLRTPKNP